MRLECFKTKNATLTKGCVCDILAVVTRFADHVTNTRGVSSHIHRLVHVTNTRGVSSHIHRLVLIIAHGIAKVNCINSDF